MLQNNKHPESRQFDQRAVCGLHSKEDQSQCLANEMHIGKSHCICAAIEVIWWEMCCYSAVNEIVIQYVSTSISL